MIRGLNVNLRIGRCFCSSAPQPLEDIFDPTTGLYVFQVLEEDVPTNNENIEDLAEEKDEEQPTGQSQSPEQVLAPTAAGG